MQIAELLTQEQLVQIQALCRYMYAIGVPRIISKFVFTLTEFFIEAFDWGDLVWSKHIIRFNTRSKQCSWVKDPLAKIHWRAETMQIGQDFFAIGGSTPTPVIRFSGLGESEKLTKTELRSAGAERSYFRLSLLEKQGRSPVIFITSGCFFSSDDINPTVTAYELNTQTTKAVPDLKYGRWNHNSCVDGRFLCVLGGFDSNLKHLDSLELLDINTLERSWADRQTECQWFELSHLKLQANVQPLTVLRFKQHRDSHNGNLVVKRQG